MQFIIFEIDISHNFSHSDLTLVLHKPKVVNVVNLPVSGT